MSRVVVVGGGVIGWSTAFHLLRQAPGVEVHVVEREPSFGMGSTGLAAGGIRAQFGTAVNIDMSLHSIRFFEEFSKVTGVDISLRQYGYLFVTSSEQGARMLREVNELQRSRGVPVVSLKADEVRERAPFLNGEDVISGSYSATDGYLDPYSVCQGFEKAARALGATAHYSCEAVSIESDRVVGRSGDSEITLDCKAVALCCGHSSKTVGELCGLDLPVVPEKHQLAMTDGAGDLPEKLPMIVDLDTSFHFRREGAGLLIGWNDSCADSTEGFDFGFLERLAPIALARLPMLNSVGFDTKRSWAGYYAETPDKHAIIGEMGGFVVATGFGGHGIMHSPAAGLCAAEQVLDGKISSIDVTALSPSRFARGNLIQELMVI